MGGGSETLIVETLVFDEGQITNPMQGSNPQWGGAMPLSHGERWKNGSNYPRGRHDVSGSNRDAESRGASGEL